MRTGRHGERAREPKREKGLKIGTVEKNYFIRWIIKKIYLIFFIFKIRNNKVVFVISSSISYKENLSSLYEKIKIKILYL